jgi:hypothetical protein
MFAARARRDADVCADLEDAEIANGRRTDSFPGLDHRFKKILTQRRKDAEEKVPSLRPGVFALRAPAGGRPSLFHQLEQVRQGFLVSPPFLGGELAGAFVQLRGHFGGLFSRTTEGNQDFGEFGRFHDFRVGRRSRGCLKTFPTANFPPLLREVEERAGERRCVFIGIPLSSVLSPLVPRGARKNIIRF